MTTTLTPVESESDANSEACNNIDQGEKADMSSEVDLETMMALSEIVAGATEETQDESSEMESTELLVLWLLAQAERLEEAFKHLNSAEWIERAVEYRRHVLALTPEGHEEWCGRLIALGYALVQRFKRLGKPVDLDEAIEYQMEAVLLTPDSHPDKPGRLSELGISHKCRFVYFGELADVDKAIECQTQALRLTADGNPNKPTHLTNLGNAHRRRFERLDELADLDKAIECQMQAALLVPDGHPNKPGMLNNLGNSHQNRFKRLDELADLEKAIECQTLASRTTPDGHPSKPVMLSSLGNSYQYRFDRLGELVDLEKAIVYLAQAVLFTPDDHADKPDYLQCLGDSYLHRFRRLGELTDLEKAIEYLTEAVLFTPNDHPKKPSQLHSLGGSHQLRFQRLGELADADKAIECHSQAMVLVADGRPEKSSILSGFGDSHLCRFQRLGELADVDKAIECQNQALLLTPDGHLNKLEFLNSLGNSHLYRFERFGGLADVDKAIECQTQSMLLTPADHRCKPIQLNGLGCAYLARHQRLGELADVDKAIECQKQAVLLTPDAHSNKAIYLNHLGCSYQCRFNRLGDLADVDEAIEFQTQAVMLTPDTHLDKPLRLLYLGCAHLCRFERLGQLVDVNIAIEFQTQSVILIPDSHPYKPPVLYNLGLSHKRRFERFHELADLEKTIEYQSQAMLLTPDGHPLKPSVLQNLAHSYFVRCTQQGALADLESAKSMFQNAAQHIITDPESQIRSAHFWAKSHILLELSPLPAYQHSMELIPHVVWIGSTIDRRYSLLAYISELTTEAAAWAISVQAYDLAIEWLEQGRSVVWNQILLLRTPFDDLDAVDDTLAQNLRRIAAQLEHASTRSPATSSVNDISMDLEKDAQYHRRLAEEWEQLLAQARGIPGFHDFLLPRRAGELKKAATDGPVVLINAHSSRWDALIIFPQLDEVVHIPLTIPPEDSADEVIEQEYREFLARHRGERVGGFGHVRKHINPESSLRAKLVKRWAFVVKPILDAMACTQTLPVAELPHVTWCATGSLASEPLHAAGPYDGSSPSAFDLVVSSYTPTLSALLTSSAPAPESDVGVLAVGQEHTQGFPSLPCTAPELEAIKRHTKKTRFQQLDGNDASVEAVLGAMNEHSLVHLACHATQNSVNPAQSAFHLSDGNLTLETITKCHFKNKRLAFLSACQTAKGDDKLPDEAVHLAAGMLMAGYPSVIATMWSILDVDGPEVAERVYAELLEGGRMDHGSPARALHKAVGELRQKIGEESFERWVPFIHIGL